MTDVWLAGYLVYPAVTSAFFLCNWLHICHIPSYPLSHSPYLFYLSFIPCFRYFSIVFLSMHVSLSFCVNLAASLFHLHLLFLNFHLYLYAALRRMPSSSVLRVVFRQQSISKEDAFTQMFLQKIRDVHHFTSRTIEAAKVITATANSYWTLGSR